MCNLDTDLHMTELEQVRLCALAMNLPFREVSHNEPQHTIRIMHIPGDPVFVSSNDSFWPFTNDLQMIVIAKRFMLHLDLFAGMAELPFARPDEHGVETKYTSYSDVSINHAIIECIATMQLHSPVKHDDLIATDEQIDAAAAGGTVIR
jgi:hypothetical protein